MAAVAQVGAGGWRVADNATQQARVGSTGWYVVTQVGGGDVTQAISGSAVTGGHGTQVPGHSIPL